MTKRKFQTVKVDLPAGSAPQTYEITETLDQGFDLCTGVTLVPIASNEDDVLRVGLKDDTETHINIVSQDFLSIDRSTPVSDRIQLITFRARGNRVTIMVQVSTALTARNAFDFVFRLENIQNPANGSINIVNTNNAQPSVRPNHK